MLNLRVERLLVRKGSMVGMVDEDFPLVDGVLDGAFGDLGCCCGDGVLESSLSVRILLRRSEVFKYMMSEWGKRVKVTGRRWSVSSRGAFILDFFFIINLMRGRSVMTGR
uniref:Uncharacterized protein n=1 Tax=Tanacetum cinerariifolium TaxID=118510 RepID=A0A699JD16_TANCI|nr:hypothetical protein [Tanacetum cinerariifolium]